MTSLFELYHAKAHDFSPGEITLCLPVTEVTVYLTLDLPCLAYASSP